MLYMRIAMLTYLSKFYFVMIVKFHSLILQKWKFQNDLFAG